MRNHKVVTDTVIMRSILEAEFEKNPQWWKKIADTTKMAGNAGAGETRKAATRYYQLIVQGHPTDVIIKFYFDGRSDYAKMNLCPIGRHALQHMIKGNYDEKHIIELLEKRNK